MHIRRSQFLVLAPSWLAGERCGFSYADPHRFQYDDLLREMQRLRGSIYLGDGAIKASDVTPDGRHALAVDERSWHILTMDEKGKVAGCMRFLEEKKATRFEDLWISQSAMARDPVWGPRFRRAVELQIDQSKRKQVSFGEVGGWAVAESRRCTTDPLKMVLAACALFRLLGGCIGLATATVRHGSAAILRRIGLMPLTVVGAEVPPYFDPQYGCEMEALRYDSDYPNPKYVGMIDELCDELRSSPVVYSQNQASRQPAFIYPIRTIPPKLPEVPSLLPIAI